jgi:hypothetical protein
MADDVESRLNFSFVHAQVRGQRVERVIRSGAGGRNRGVAFALSVARIIDEQKCAADCRPCLNNHIQSSANEPLPQKATQIRFGNRPVDSFGK